MAVQRFLTALVWFAMAAGGALLLRPDFFPDVQIPDIGLSPQERWTMGLILASVAGLIALGAFGEMLRGQPAPRKPSPRRYAPVDIPVDQSMSPLVRPPAPRPVPTSPPSTERFPTLSTTSNGRKVGFATAQSPVNDPEPLSLSTTGPDRSRLSQLTRAADAARAGGRKEEAVDLYDQALREARLLHATQPTDPVAQGALAEALARVAGQEQSDGRLDSALAPYEESLSLHRGLAASAPESPDRSASLVTAMGRLADCRDARGHHTRARDLYAEAVKIAERLHWLTPGSDGYATLLAHAKDRLAAINADIA